MAAYSPVTFGGDFSLAMSASPPPHGLGNFGLASAASPSLMCLRFDRSHNATATLLHTGHYAHTHQGGGWVRSWTTPFTPSKSVVRFA